MLRIKITLSQAKQIWNEILQNIQVIINTRIIQMIIIIYLFF